jgi:glucose-1-phosphate adenylyltransferase
LSNCIHSGIRRIFVVTQYRSYSLEKHIQLGWSFLSEKLNEFVRVVSAQQRIDEQWYLGTADAIYQNLYILQQIRPELTLILSGDHIYKMDYQDLLSFHQERAAHLTVATVPQPREMSRHYGVMEVDPEQRVLSFQEKPDSPRGLPGDPERVLASMGIYVFDTRLMVRRLVEDAKSDTHHDFGRDIIPRMVEMGDRVFAYIFQNPSTGEARYWRDVGTLDAYWEAHMDLLGEKPAFDLYDPQWPILTHDPPAPPAKILSPTRSPQEGIQISNCILSDGCLIRAEKLSCSVLSPYVQVLEGAQIEDSILLDRVVVEAGTRLRRVIVDKGAVIPSGWEIGFDKEKDRRHFTVTSGGLVVIPRDWRID